MHSANVTDTIRRSSRVPITLPIAVTSLEPRAGRSPQGWITRKISGDWKLARKIGRDCWRYIPTNRNPRER